MHCPELCHCHNSWISPCGSDITAKVEMDVNREQPWKRPQPTLVSPKLSLETVPSQSKSVFIRVNIKGKNPNDLDLKILQECLWGVCSYPLFILIWWKKEMGSGYRVCHLFFDQHYAGNVTETGEMCSRITLMCEVSVEPQVWRGGGVGIQPGISLCAKSTNHENQRLVILHLPVRHERAGILNLDEKSL